MVQKMEVEEETKVEVEEEIKLLNADTLKKENEKQKQFKLRNH